MNKFIIQYETRIDGEVKKSFHNSIIPIDESRGFMNVYAENVSLNKDEAKVFYCKEEAEKVCNLFSNSTHKGKIITYKK